MDTKALVDRDIAEGRRLIQALDAANFPVVAALWSLFFEEREWRLLLASPTVAEGGPLAAYTEILTVMRAESIQLRLDQVSAVPPNDPLVAALRIFAGTDGAPVVGGVDFDHAALGDQYIRGAYVYRAERIVEESGTKELLVVVRDKPSKVWKAYRCMATFKNGLFDEVKVEGYEWPQSHSRKGLKIRLYVLAYPRKKRGETIGDVERWTVVNGRLDSIKIFARDVRVEGIRDTKLPA